MGRPGEVEARGEGARGAPATEEARGGGAARAAGEQGRTGRGAEEGDDQRGHGEEQGMRQVVFAKNGPRWHLTSGPEAPRRHQAHARASKGPGMNHL